MPVKFPGWSQPGVWGLQAWIEAMKRVKRVRRKVYMIAVELSVVFYLGCFSGKVGLNVLSQQHMGPYAVFKDLMLFNFVSIFALFRCVHWLAHLRLVGYFGLERLILLLPTQAIKDPIMARALDAQLSVWLAVLRLFFKYNQREG